MLTLSLVLTFLSTLYLNAATKVNVEVTLNKKDAFLLFSEDELWGFDYVNQTADIVKVNVVIDESKSIEISALSKDIIMGLTTIYSNVEAALDAETQRLNNRTKWSAGIEADIFFEEYRDWTEYEVFIQALLLKFPNLLSRRYIGTTIQNRPIPLITLSTGTGTKPGFYIQAELHAREWLANAATLYILNELAEGYGNDASITNILNNVNIYIVPTVNIDGYIYSWSSSSTRMWRKNRRNNGNNIYGVDLNRNYNAPQFCQVGASTNPSSDTYCGTSPLSEPESSATAQFVVDPANNIVAVFDMHTYGPLILWPWAYTYTRAPDYTQLRDLGAALQTAVHSVNGHVYTSQQASDLYPCAGTMVDSAYYFGKIKSITFEGRGPGFNAPATNIIPAGEEQLAAVIVLAQGLF